MLKYLKLLLEDLKNSDYSFKYNEEKIFSLELAIEILEERRKNEQ